MIVQFACPCQTMSNPTGLLCDLCGNLANFAVKGFLTAKIAKGAQRLQRKPTPPNPA
jgi:hypothetical protein